MGAAEHEELAKILNGIIRSYLEGQGQSTYEEQSLYLGNWIADFSQFLDQSVAKKVFDALNGGRDLLINGINQLEGAIRREAEAGKLKIRVQEALTALASGTFSKQLLLLASEQLLSGESDIIFKRLAAAGNKLADELAILQTDLRNLDGLPTQVNEESLGAISNALRAVTQLVGYYKFVLTSEKSMDPEVFSSITDALLKPYYPSDHLDRSFDLEKLRRRPPRGDDLDKIPGQYLVNDFITDSARDYLTGRNIEYRLKNTQQLPGETDESYAAQLAAIKETAQGNLGLYPYLEEFLLVACGKLSRLERTFRRLDEEDVDVNVALAQLGNALHTFEDYFAHSNFIDFLLLVIYNVGKYGSDAPPLISDRAKFREFFSPTNKKSSYTAGEINRSVRSTVRLEVKPGKTGVIDDRISTGYFGGPDIYISLYHLAVGMVEKISVFNSEEDLTEGNNFGVLIDLVFNGKKLEELEEDYPEMTKHELMKHLIVFSLKKDQELRELREDYEELFLLRSVEEEYNGERRRAYEEREQYIEEKYERRTQPILDQLYLLRQTDELIESYVASAKQFVQTGEIGQPSPAENAPNYLSREEVRKLFSHEDKFLFGNGKGEEEKTVFFLWVIMNQVVLAQQSALLADRAGLEFNFVKGLVKNLKIVRQVTAIVKLIRILGMSLPEALLVALGPVGKELTLAVLEKVLMGMLRETVQVRFLSEYRTGSHGLMAKDEEFEKPNLHRNAMAMAAYIDELIIRNLFRDSERIILQAIETARKEEESFRQFQIVHEGVTYGWYAHDPGNQLSKEAIYRWLQEEHPSLKRTYMDWSFLLTHLCYETAVPHFKVRRLPRYILRSIHNPEKKFGIPDIAISPQDVYRKNLRLYFKQFNTPFTDRSSVTSFSPPNTYPAKIKIPTGRRLLPTVTSNAALPINSIFTDIILSYEHHYEGKIPLYPKGWEEEEAAQFAAFTGEVESEVKADFDEVSHFLNIENALAEAADKKGMMRAATTDPPEGPVFWGVDE